MSDFSFMYRILKESPRWLLTKGRKDDAETILSVIARTNDTKLPDDIEIYDDDNKTETILIVIKKIMKSRIMIVRILIMLFNW
jgi:hypothetical protein